MGHDLAMQFAKDVAVEICRTNPTIFPNESTADDIAAFVKRLAEALEEA